MSTRMCFFFFTVVRKTEWTTVGSNLSTLPTHTHFHRVKHTYGLAHFAHLSTPGRRTSHGSKSLWTLVASRWRAAPKSTFSYKNTHKLTSGPWSDDFIDTITILTNLGCCVKCKYKTKSSDLKSYETHILYKTVNMSNKKLNNFRFYGSNWSKLWR